MSKPDAAVVIVPKAEWENPDANRVSGIVSVGDVDGAPAGGARLSVESFMPGAVPYVNWRGDD